MEALNAYEPLKEYVNREASPDFKLGAAVTAADFLNRDLVYSRAVSNFDEVVAVNAFKYGTVVDNNGMMNVGPVSSLVNVAREADIAVFGHTLLWHAQQNNRWLNGLIAPVVIPPPPVEPGSGGNGGFGMKITAVGGGDAAYSTQVRYDLPDENRLINGTSYTIKFMARAESPITVPMVMQETVSGGWQQTGHSVNLTTEWTEFEWQFTPSFDNGNQFCFNIGQVEGTFYVDNFTLSETESDNNIIPNSDFEEGNVNGWGSPAAIADGMGFSVGAGYAMKIVATGGGSDSWSTQVRYNLPDADRLTQGASYVIKFVVKGESEFSVPMVMQETVSGSYAQTGGSVNVTKEWTEFSWSFSPGFANGNQFCFNIGQVEGTFYVDNFSLAETDGGDNIIPNGDFEEGNVAGWGPPAVVTEFGLGYSASGPGKMWVEKIANGGFEEENETNYRVTGAGVKEYVEGGVTGRALKVTNPAVQEASHGTQFFTFARCGSRPFLP